MALPTDTQRPPGFLKALWSSFMAFIGSLFHRSPRPAALPAPVTARPPQTRPTSALVRVTRPRIDLPNAASVKEPTPLKCLPPSVSANYWASPQATHRPESTTPEHIFHPPASPLAISLSGIFATPPFLASPIELGRLSFASPPAIASPPSPSRASHGVSSPSFHTLHSGSPRTPRTPSSVVIVRLDRSTISPTTMSDGSLEVISLGDRRGFPGSPIELVDIGYLPSPWSPVGKTTSSDIWMSVDGVLMNAAGPADVNPTQPQGDSTALKLTVSGISPSSLYSSPSSLNALGISMFVNLDEVKNVLSSESKSNDTRVDQIHVSKPNEVRDENIPTLIDRGPQTPRRRRDTLPSATESHTPTHSARPIKRLSTPLAKADSVKANHVCSMSSTSSMAYDIRLGLLADGRSMTAIENIISFLDQASPESTPQPNDATQSVEATS